MIDQIQAAVRMPDSVLAEVILADLAATEQLAGRLGNCLKPGDVIALDGPPASAACGVLGVDHRAVRPDRRRQHTEP